MKRMLALAAVLSVLLRVPLTAEAHELPQERNDCTIEVVVRYNGEDVNGGTLTAVKVGYVDQENGDFFFSQEITGQRLDDIASPDAPGIQEEFYGANRDSYEFYTQTQPVADGRAVFTDLPTGLYLIIQEEPAEGFTPLGSFLVGVPYLEDGEYQYDVTATIKSEVEREPEPTAPLPTEPGPSLPQTGQLNWPIPLLAVSGSVLFIAGWILCFGNKRERHEK